MQIKNKHSIIIIISLIIFLFIEGIYLYVLPKVFDINKNRALIEKIFQEKTGAKLNIEGIKLNTYADFTFGLNSDKLTVAYPPTKKIIEAENIYIKIPLIPLLFKEINIKNLTAKKLNLDVERYKNGKYNLERLLFKSEKKVFKVKLKNTKFNISRYNIKFNDKKTNKHCEMKGNYFKVSNFTMKKLIDIDTQGTITAPNVNTEYQVRVYTKLPLVKNLDSSQFIISGFIKNFEPKYFAPYITEYADKNIKDVSGKLSFDFYTKKLDNNKKQLYIEGAIQDFSIKKSKTEENISALGKNIVFAKVNLDKKEINIINASVKGNKYQINAKGSIQDYKTKKPYLNLTASIPKSRVENIVYMLPANLIPKREEIRKVKKYGLFGDIQANIEVKGKLPQPNITGTVNGTNIQVLKGTENTHKGTIHLSFEKRKLITDVKIEFKTKEYITVKGLTYIFRDGINHFKIKSTKALGLNLAQKLLLPIQDVFQFQLGPVPQMKFIAGTGDVDLDIRGTKLSGVVKGYVSFKNASASYNDIAATLNGGNGRVDFFGKKITYKTTNAYIKNYPIEIFGDAIINGDVDFNIATKKVDSKIILDIVNNSKLLEEIKEKMLVLTDVSGPTAFKLNLRAKIKSSNSIKIDPKEALKDMKILGNLTFEDAKCSIKGFKTQIQSVKGKVDFTQTNVKFSNITAKVDNSPIKIYGTIKNNILTNTPTIDFYVESKRIQLKDSLKFLLESDIGNKLNKNIIPLYKLNGQHDLLFNYKSSSKSKEIDLNGINLTVNFIPQISNKSVKINSGRITLTKGNLSIDNVNAKVYNTIAKISGKVNNLYAKKPSYNLEIKTNKFDLKALNDISKYTFLPASLKKQISQYTDFSGQSDVTLHIDPMSVKGQLNLANVKFSHKESGVPITINGANIKLDSNRIVAKSLDANIGNSPVYGEFTISNLFTKPSINGYFTTKITDNFVDTYINNKLTYPIKVKGDITLNADISGNLDNIEIEPELKLNEGSDISYLSANLGDDTDVREIDGNIFVTKDSINIRKIEYKKYITSQNNKIYPINLALIKGNLVKYNNKYELDSFFVRTNNNLPTRLLNFVFKKSILKHGTFNCSIFYKSNLKTHVPKVFGNIDFKNVDIPLYDTIIKDVSIDSNKDLINLDIKGTIFNSDFAIVSSISNRLVFPIDIKDLDISSKKFNFDKLLDTLNRMSIDAYQNKDKQVNQNNFNLEKILIRKGHLKAEDVSFKSLPASNLNADFILNEKSVLNINDLKFDIAGGTLTGDSEYNFKDRTFETSLVTKNVDANLMSDALFNMKGQLYGKMNGQLYVHTKGSNQDERLKNLSGLVYFNLADGKMPKLGSLEYLLKAGNIVKSGITGLTINSIIDIVNPIKTGHFSAINGSFALDDGVAKNVEIYSKGENLSIFVKGSYDLVNSNADMRVLGRLSKKIPTLLGPVGNASINSLFNIIPGITLADADRVKFMKDISKIPGLDFTNDDYRIFQAKIDGNINGNNYVSSFKWVE